MVGDEEKNFRFSSFETAGNRLSQIYLDIYHTYYHDYLKKSMVGKEMGWLELPQPPPHLVQPWVQEQIDYVRYSKCYENTFTLSITHAVSYIDSPQFLLFEN